jgi:hypothetical protein
MARKLLLFGAAVVAAGIFLKRDKVAGLLPSRTEPYEPPAPGPSNYDAPGPVANTATPVPAPEAHQPAAIDEAAEEAAAAAEAANIGGTVSDYVGPSGERADEAFRPLAEAGEGEAEGQEQAEFELEQAAQPTAPGMSDEQRQIEEAIEQADNPLAGEVVEPVRPADEPGEASTSPSASDLAQPEPETTGWAPPAPQTPAEGTASPAGPEPTPTDPSPSPAGETSPPSPAATEPPTEVQDTGVGQGGQVPKPDDPAPFDEHSADTPAADKDDASAGAGPDDKDEGGEGTDWRTWSGRSINP